MFIHSFVTSNRYVHDFQLLTIYLSNSILNCFVDAFCSVDVKFSSFSTYINVLLALNILENVWLGRSNPQLAHYEPVFLNLYKINYKTT